MFNLDEASRKNKEAVDGLLKNYAEVTKGFQAIASETGEYSKKSIQELTSFLEQLLAVRSIETAFELQSKFAKSAYEGFVAEATKIGTLYTDLAKSAYKPYELPATRATAVVVSNAA
ncbi:hypothetical protein J2858_002552 [Neorhizobium galegae]|uniref:phasin family protein n=1 Tax=Neorhizobium galegae TaxID=399 RepID=UPI001AEA04AE|nr:phasin family protein [Neorhizobium galegae]MBP2549629.1 hypothetical protein [Neorhizobium galegae]